MGKKTSSKLGDTRLDDSFKCLIGAMVIKYTAIIKQLAENRAEQMRYGRFINNPKITAKGLVNHYCSNCSTDVSGKHLLVVNDTSTISFDYRADRKGLGFVGRGSDKSGFDVHPAIMMDAEDGGCYGLGGISIYKTKFYKTAEEQAIKKELRKNSWKIPFEEKERFKWFEAPKQAIENYPNASRYTLIGDRESDIYELIGRTVQQNWDYLYRSRTNRTLSEEDTSKTLYKAIEKWSIADSYELKLSGTKNRTAHKAKMDLKFGSVTIKQPDNSRDRTIASQIKLQVVEVKERPQTVIGQEKPVHWILLTSHPVNCIEQAMQIVKWYLWRWTIEQLFRTLKLQGLNVEKSEVETFEALVNLTTMALLAAVQIMQLVQARDGQTLQKLEDVFFQPEIECLKLLNTKLEGKTDKQKNPHPTQSLAFASWVIARLGGWKGYKKSRPPGPIIMIKGLTRFYNILEGFYLIC